MNQKFANDLKKDSEKQMTFVYSKFSPVDNCLKKEKVLLRDMVSLVQTNLLKLYVDLKEKDKIYQFFTQQSNQVASSNRMVLLDAKELEEYIKKT